jgi:glycerophosphoryl diester phosphodiesterase
MSAFKVIAHRGASAYAPDNTTAAFRLAIEQGAPMIETDVQMTADGVLVLVHDWMVSGRLVASVTLAELRTRVAGLLTVAEALAMFGAEVPFCWEVKQPGIENALVTAVRSAVPDTIWQQTEFTSFFPTSALACRQAAPGTMVGWLTQDYSRAAIDAVHAAGLPQYCPPAGKILEQPELVAYAREKNLTVRAWQMRDPAWTPRLAQLGVYGATVNWPDTALAALHSRDPH